MTVVVTPVLDVRRAPPAVTVADGDHALAALPATYVHPGQVAISDDTGVLTTILGSCVAVCLHDPALHVGGLNHYLLPSAANAPEVASRYGPLAITQLVQGMIAYGAQAKRMSAQIFGGAAVLAAFSDERNHLGMRNAQLAREMMAQYGIVVIGCDIGGNRGRKLTFSPRDGRAHVKLIGTAP